MIKAFEERPLLTQFIAVVGAVLIYYVSSVEFQGQGGGLNILAVIYHFLAFFFFGAFVMIGIVQGKNKSLFIPAVMIAATYAVLDEVHQYYVPGRFFSYGDILTDFFGIAFALVIYLIILEYQRA